MIISSKRKEIIRWVRIVVLKTLKDKRLTHLDVDTLVSAGLLGYSQSLKRFDPLRGVKFRTFAEYRIKGAVLDEVRKMIGDERCKNKRPRISHDFDFESIEDRDNLSDIDSQVDMENFLCKSDFTQIDLEILSCRVNGMNIREISSRFGLGESKVSQILANIKIRIYPWLKSYVGTNGGLQARICPSCGHSSMLLNDIKRFQCESCGSDIEFETGTTFKEEIEYGY